MDSHDLPPHSLRKIVHDLNGELFLIRGFADLSLGKIENNHPIAENIRKILRRTDELEHIIQKLRQKQKILEPDE